MTPTQQNWKDIQERSLALLLDKQAHYELLTRYTKKTVLLNSHRWHIRFYQEVIAEAKKEYAEYPWDVSDGKDERV